MGTKKDQNAAEQTLNPTVSFPASLRIYCKSWTSKSWGGSTSMALLVMLTWLLSLAGSSSPLQFFSLFLTSPNSWGCHCVFGFTLSFTHCPLGCTMPGLPSRLLNYRWKPFWSHNSGILHVTETSTIVCFHSEQLPSLLAVCFQCSRTKSKVQLPYATAILEQGVLGLSS